MENSNSDILKTLSTIVDKLDDLSDRTSELEYRLADLELGQKLLNNHNDGITLTSFFAKKDYTTDEQLDEDEAEELQRYLSCHYALNCNLDEELSKAQFEELGFDLTQDEINKAVQMYQETTTL